MLLAGICFSLFLFTRADFLPKKCFKVQVFHIPLCQDVLVYTAPTIATAPEVHFSRTYEDVLYFFTAPITPAHTKDLLKMVHATCELPSLPEKIALWKYLCIDLKICVWLCLYLRVYCPSFLCPKVLLNLFGRNAMLHTHYLDKKQLALASKGTASIPPKTRL